MAGPVTVRGRRPGPLPRGICPACQRDVHLLGDGTIGTHRRLYANGYTRGPYCGGKGMEPDCCVGESANGVPNALHDPECPVYLRDSTACLARQKARR